MQRGAKDFAKKASVNAEKSFFNDFLSVLARRKIEVECNEKDLLPTDYLLKHYPESQMYVSHTQTE